MDDYDVESQVTDSSHVQGTSLGATMAVDDDLRVKDTVALLDIISFSDDPCSTINNLLSAKDDKVCKVCHPYLLRSDNHLS